MRSSTKWLLAGLFLACFVMMVVLSYYKPADGYHGVQFAEFRNAAAEVKSSMPEKDRETFVSGVKLDFLFLILYPCTLSLACRYAARYFPESSRLNRAGRLLSVLVLTAIPSDVIDNLSVLRYLSSGSSRLFLMLGGVCTIWNFTIGGVSLLFFVSMTIAARFKKAPASSAVSATAASELEQAVGFSTVVNRERELILKKRRQSKDDGGDDFVGLALSGGGIRSATFSLGILQALADFGLLHRVDYLSTVSGGGYIGSWLLARMSQNGQLIESVEKELSPRRSSDPNTPAWAPIQFLRAYSNYLTPELGFLSADTWSIAAIWARNTILIQFVLILALSALLLIPRWAYIVVSNLDGAWATVPALTLLAIVVMASAVGLKDFGTRQSWTQYKVLWGVVAPLFLICLYSAVVIRNGRETWTPAIFASGVGVVVMAALVIIQAAAKLGRGQRREVVSTQKLIFFSVLSSGLAAALAYALSLVSTGAGDLWVVMTFGPVVVIAALSLVLTWQVGLLGRALPDGQREWVSRAGAWLNICGLCWFAVSFTAIYAPLVMLWLHERFQAVLPTLTIGWAISTIAGLAAAWSSKSGGSNNRTQSASLKLIATYAPYVFVTGLLFLLSFVMHIITVGILPPSGQPLFLSLSGILSGDGFAAMKNQYWEAMTPSAPQAWGFLAVALGLFVIALLLSRRFDLNEFSMHHLYKNRLIRCYLGAARSARTPDKFVGFDPSDDIPLHELSRRPYPIINASLNLVHGKRLAWQERKAASFVLTPEYCGFDRSVAAPDVKDPRLAEFAYRATKHYGGQVHLGTAMAISGAAVNPNMGSFTSSATAFLMTAFNVRMGWWLGNPRHNVKWQQASPKTGIFYLLSELTGGSNDERGFVNLSDGGHFENLGIYELVRRRCKYIISCDGSQDSEFAFEDLGNAIRKCRADFGAEIHLDLRQIQPDPITKRSRAHCAVGRVCYPKTDTEQASTGILVYVKTSLTGDEPSDILEYSKLHPEFPHQSTADQWFNESQFESYRRLGYDIGQKVFQRSVPPLPVDEKVQIEEKPIKSVFDDLFNAWFPPSLAVEKSFARHGQAFDQLVERLRSSKDLQGLAQEFYGALDGESSEAKFLYCNSVIQLMENVYIDLGLEDAFDHPDNQGWMTIFRLWWSSPTFKRAWKVSKTNFGSRFERWCERELEKKAEMKEH